MLAVTPLRVSFSPFWEGWCLAGQLLRTGQSAVLRFLRIFIHSRWTWRFIAAVYTGLIFARNFRELKPVTQARSVGVLNPLHVPAYALLCWLIWKCFPDRRAAWRLPVLLSVWIATLDEAFQAVRLNQAMEWNDWSLNLLGIAIIGVWMLGKR